MCRKSEVVGYMMLIIENIIIVITQVPLGIILKNENKTSEMVQIMEEMHTAMFL